MLKRSAKNGVPRTALVGMALVGACVAMMGTTCPIIPPPVVTPITVTATASATTVTPNTQVQITANVQNATGTVTYAWSVTGVGGLAGSLSGSQVTFLSANVGTAIVTVTAADSGTGTSETATVTITVEAAPPPACTLDIAASASPSAVTLPAGSTLAVTITTAGTAPYTYSWLQTAGDPATIANAAAQNTAVTFPAAGTYTFNVTVTDNAGCADSAAVTVTVTGTPATVDTTFTLNIDDLTGSTGDDVFLAGQEWDTGALNNTLQTGDRADGNGGNDALDATVNIPAANIRPILTNIQTINITATASAGQIQLDNSTGITAVNSTGSAALVDFNALQTLPTTIGLFNNDDNGLTLSAIAAAATAASNDATTLQLSGARAAGGAEPTAVVTLNTAAASGIETLTIDSSGSVGNEIDQLATTGNTTSMTTLNVTGSQSLEIMDWSGGVTLPASILTINASAMTAGGVALRPGNGAVAFTGSPFDDVIYHGANYTTADTIDGGAGTDTVAVTTALAAVAGDQSNVTSIEAVTITDAHTTAPVFTRWGSIAQVNLEGGFTAGTVTLPTGSDVVIGKKHTNNVAGAGAGTIAVSGGTPGTVTVTLADADPAGLITVNNATTVDLASNGNLNGTAAGGNINVMTGLTVAAAGAKTVNISGSTALNVGALTGAGVVNAGTFDQNLTVVLGNAATYTGGSAVDTVTGSAGDDTISGGAGNDVIVAGAGDDSIDGGVGNDTITPGVGNDIMTGGAGNDEFIFTDSADNSVWDGGANVLMDFTTAQDKITLDKSNLGLNDAAGALAEASYFEGAAGGMTAGTAYQVVVLTGAAYANVGAAEDAVAAASTSAGTEAVIIYFDSTDNVARMFYDADLDVDDGLTNAASMATFNNVTSLGNMAGAFAHTDFNIQA